MLKMNRVSLDDPNHRFHTHRIQGFPIQASGPFMERYRSWKPFEIISVENHLAQARDAVIDFGAGHSSYEDPELLERARIALGGVHVILLLPSIDHGISEATLNCRNNQNPEIRELNEHLLADSSNRQLAQLIIYTNGKLPREVALEIMERLKISMAG